MMKKRKPFEVLLKRLREPRRFIQSLIGPPQVGKTTLARQLADELGGPSRYVTADLATLKDTSWLQQQWDIARELAKAEGKALLIIDEIQKIPHWSDMAKFLWDQDTASGVDLSVLILGSSPWLMQKGLTESLAGRFEIIPMTHWSFKEMHEIFGISYYKELEQQISHLKLEQSYRQGKAAILEKSKLTAEISKKTTYTDPSPATHQLTVEQDLKKAFANTKVYRVLDQIIAYLNNQQISYSIVPGKGSHRLLRIDNTLVPFPKHNEWKAGRSASIQRLLKAAILKNQS